MSEVAVVAAPGGLWAGAKGAVVLDSNGEVLGVVDDVRTNPETGRLDGIVVRVGGMLRAFFFGGGDRIRISAAEITDVNEQTVRLNSTKEAFLEAGDIARRSPRRAQEPPPARWVPGSSAVRWEEDTWLVTALVRTRASLAEVRGTALNVLWRTGRSAYARCGSDGMTWRSSTSKPVSATRSNS